MDKQLNQKASYLLIIYSFIVLGYIYNLGFYSITSLVILTFSAFLSLFYWKLNFSTHLFNVEIVEVAKLVLVCFAALSNYLYGGLYQSSHPGLVTASTFLLAFCVPFSFTYFLKFNRSTRSFIRYRFWLLIFIVLALKLFMVWSSPSPRIDVFGIEKMAPKAILEGSNPYSIIYHFPWQKPLDVYSYGPMSIYLNFPAVFLLSDPRYVHIFSEVGIALIVFIILKKSSYSYITKNNLHEILPLIFLFNPRGLFILEQAWMDPVLVFFITLFSYILIVRKQNFAAFIVLGFALAIKQYALFVLPFLFVGGFLNLKRMLTVLITFMILAAPFLMWSAKDFIRDVVLFNLTIQESRYDSLSFNSLVYKIFDNDIPSALVLIILALLFIYFLKFKKHMKEISMVFYCSGMFALFTFLLYRLAFIHYYYYAGSLIFLALVHLLYKENRSNKNLPQK